MAQVNLVVNPSFEIYDTCPSTVDQITFAQGWFQPNTLYGSTDYFNSCSSNWITSVPSNITGYQPARSGQAYAAAGIVIQVSWNYGREYLEGSLSQPLDSNRKYCTSIYTSLTNNSELSTEIGIKFTPDSLLYAGPSYQTLNVVPQIVITDIIALEDTVGWVLSHKIYTSVGGERFLTFGNFWNQPALLYDCFGPNCGVAYYCFDDISVVLLPDLYAGLDDTICLTDSTILTGVISETWPGMSFEWLPHTGLSNPFSLSTTASPNTTTTYTLTVSCATCDVPCLSDIPDSVTITVLPQVNAPFDDTLCLGDSLLLTGIISEQWNGMQYEWLPHTGLSDPFSLSTFASPAGATTYTLTATCSSCGFTTCATLRDSIYLAVKMDCAPVFNEMIVPTLVGSNQRWEIMFLQPNTRVKIYDERGRIIFETENYQNNWIPTFSGAMYFFEITLPDGNKSTGKIVVN